MDEKKIQHYINDPVLNAATAPELKLVRPSINYAKTVCFLFLFLLAVLAITISVSLSIEFLTSGDFDRIIVIHQTIKLLPYVFLVAVVLCLRFLLIWLVKAYQRYAKSETRLRCCFEPSCSDYAILAMRKYGALVGGIKAISRLLRCKPPGGIDYP